MKNLFMLVVFLLSSLCFQSSLYSFDMGFSLFRAGGHSNSSGRSSGYGKAAVVTGVVVAAVAVFGFAYKYFSSNAVALEEDDGGAVEEKGASVEESVTVEAQIRSIVDSVIASSGLDINLIKSLALRLQIAGRYSPDEFERRFRKCADLCVSIGGGFVGLDVNVCVGIIVALEVNNNLSITTLQNNLARYRELTVPAGVGAAVEAGGAASGERLNADLFPDNTKMICENGHSDICLGCYKGAVRAGRALKCEAGGCDSTKIYPKVVFDIVFPGKQIFDNGGECRLCVETL